MNANTTNPLLDFSGLPQFDIIRADHVTPAVDALLAEGRRTIEAVATATTKPSWETVVEPLAEPLDRLDRAWGVVRHLNAVVNTPELREAHNANLPKVIAFYTALAQDLRLFAK
jgi:oligopeptidase A